jgi:hypothetical protein
MDTGTVTFRFNHPSRDLRSLSDVFGVVPRKVWTAGEARQTPAGTPLPGTYRDSFWTLSLEFEPENGFEDRLVEVLDLLCREKATVEELQSTGGKVQIYLQLVGWVNNGGSIDALLLKRMVDLGATFEIEVFPN